MSIKLSEIVAQFFAWADKALAPGTVREYHRHIDRFAKHVGDVDMVELKPHHLLTWGRTWHQIQAVQRLTHWACVDAELVPTNPFKRVKRPVPGQRRRVLTRAVATKILRSACPEFRVLLITMRETLARPQEVRVFAWELIQWEDASLSMQEALQLGQAVFVLERYKCRERMANPNKPRLIPISPRLGRLLVRISRKRQELAGMIFQNTEGQAWTANAMRLQMKRIRTRLQIGPDHRGEKIVCYTLRHTMGTQASACGVKDKLLAELMGHTSPRTTARYQHLDVEHLQEALRRVRFPRRKRQ